MGIWAWLFGKRAAVQAKPTADTAPGHVDVAGGFLSASSINKQAPARAWVRSWNDATPDGRRGGHREEGEGRYVLLDVKNNAVVDGRMPRPNNGVVADNGTFCLEDWHCGSTLSGTFHVFTAQGLPIITKVLTANILQSGISRNGLLAYCLTANSPTEDGRKLALYDLKEGVELFAVTPRRGYERIGFDEQRLELVVKAVGGGEYRYGADGALLDEEGADRALLNSTNYVDVILTAETMLKDGSGDVELQKVVAALIRARALGADDNPGWKATALKVQGLAHEGLGEVSEAIGCYGQALSLNPKIGVKRKMNALVEQLK